MVRTMYNDNTIKVNHDFNNMDLPGPMNYPSNSKNTSANKDHVQVLNQNLINPTMINPPLLKVP